MNPSELVDAEGVREAVDAAVDAHLTTARRGAVAEYGPEAGPLYDAAERLLSGGKRLRAAFAYWSWRAHGGAPDSAARTSVVGVGAALELFQAAALFHDDLIDHSDTRRGLPTAHVHFAGRHAAARWPGNPADYGTATAVLLGDLTLVASDEVFTGSIAPLPAEVVATARGIFDQMRTEVTIGQYLDVLNQVRPWPDDAADAERTARDVVRAKSARYSVEHPICLGAALAGAGPDQLRTCRELGLPLGEAFQLRDDVLGVFGDPAVTGKPAGDDLREGKRTVLVARALQAASPADGDRIRELLGSDALDDAGIEQLRSILVSSGALAEVEGLVDQLTEQAFAVLDRAQLDPVAARMLRELGTAAVRRAA